MSQRLLFLCPHNAAKSVMAAAYFDRRAGDVGLEARAFSAGTEPDEEVAPHVATLLTKEGYNAGHEPRKVSREDLERADRIISLGCALDDLPRTDKEVIRWDEVPPPSQDLEGAWGLIKARVDDLIGQLSSTSGKA